MSGNPDRGITKSNKSPDLHQDLTDKKGNENNSPEDVHGSKHDSSCSPNEFPGLPGSNRQRVSRSDRASEFWSQGLANLKALDTRSKGDRKDGEVAALIKEARNRLARRDPAKSASTYPRDKSHGPRLLFFPEPDIPSAISSKKDNQAQPLPDSSISASKKTPNVENEPTSLPQGHPLRLPDLDAGVVDQSLEVEAEKGRSPTPASVSSPPKKSLLGNEHESSKDADAIPPHTDPVSSTGITCVKNEDTLLVRPAIEKIEPALPISPSPKSKNSCLSADSGLSPPKPRQTPETPSKPSNTSQHNGLFLISPIARPLEPCSILSISSNKPSAKTMIERLKSRSAHASPGHSSPSSGSPTAPRSHYRQDHESSVSLGSGQPSPSYVSVMPKTPYWQHNPRYFRQNGMGTLPIPSESGVHTDPRESSQPPPAHLYPAPKQHPPEGQGQFFDVQRCMPLPMPAHSPHPISPIRPHFPSSLHSFRNHTIHQHAQVYEQGEQNAEYSQSNHFDSYATSQAANAAPNTADLHQNGNIYTQDTNVYGPRYYSNHTDPTHQARLCPLRKGHVKLTKFQLNQNLYSPLEPHREPSKPNQRTAKDLFIPEDLRLKLHARTEATLRVFAGKFLRYRTSQCGLGDIHPSESLSNEHTRRRTLPYPYAFDSH